MKNERVITQYSSQLDDKPLDLLTTPELKQLGKEFFLDKESEELCELTAIYMHVQSKKGVAELRKELERIYLAFRTLSLLSSEVMKKYVELLRVANSQNEILQRRLDKELQRQHYNGTNEN